MKIAMRITAGDRQSQMKRVRAEFDPVIKLPPLTTKRRKELLSASSLYLIKLAD